MRDIQISFTIPYSDFVLGTLLLVFAITFYLAISKNWEWLKTRANPLPWMAEHYVALLLPLGFIAITLAIYFWIWDIRGEISRLVALLNGQTTPEDIRNLAYAIAALLGAVALSATIPFQLIKVWANERLAKTTEQGHMTDRITKAVEQLGAEKTVKLHRKDSAGKKLYEEADGKLNYKKPVITETTEPNLEVRLGAIYCLERIAQDSIRDHIPVLDILCAYVRLNSPRENGVEFMPFTNQYRYTNSSMTEIERQHEQFKKTPDEKTHLEKQEREVDALPLMRIDIQAALTSIGRRPILGVNLLNHSNYSPNLSGCNLQKAELIGDFSHADFSDSLWDGATLSGEFENCFVDHRKTVALKMGPKELYALNTTGRPKPQY